MFWRTETISAKRETRLNDKITSSEVRVIGANGDQVGILSIEDALRISEEADLDLVEISPNADPPVCRVMDFGKFQYEESKRKAAAKKKQKHIHVKEVKFRPGTEIHDYNIKVGKLIQFLENGDKAKVTLRFRGREMAHRELGLDLLKRVEADLVDIGVVEQHPKMEGRQMVMVLNPKREGNKS